MNRLFGRRPDEPFRVGGRRVRPRLEERSGSRMRSVYLDAERKRCSATTIDLEEERLRLVTKHFGRNYARPDSGCRRTSDSGHGACHQPDPAGLSCEELERLGHEVRVELEHPAVSRIRIDNQVALRKTSRCELHSACGESSAWARSSN